MKEEKRKEIIKDVFSIMKQFGYSRNNYNGITNTVYNKKYSLPSRYSKTYVLTVVFDYRNIEEGLVTLYVYDEKEQSYLTAKQTPTITEVITIAEKLFDMGLEIEFEEEQ